MVAEDPALGDAIARLAGEWSELSGGEMVVSQALGSPLEGAPFPEGDLLVFPSRLLGALAEDGYLRPVRESTLKGEKLAFDDFFPLVRQREIVFGNRVMALPLGCPTPLLTFDAGKDKRPPPAAWSDLASNPPHQCLAKIDEDRQWAYLLIMRAACYASHPARDAVLFDPRTMTPRLTDPPFVRAMTELQGMASKAAVAGPAVSSASVLLGPGGKESICWPIRPTGESYLKELPDDERAQVELRLSQELGSTSAHRLPGASEVYNPLSGEWEAVDGSPRRVTLLATSGRLIGVTTSSRNAASAFRLAAWLVGPDNAALLSKASPRVASPRLSLAGLGDDWPDVGNSRLSRSFGRALGESLQSRRSLTVPRIHKVDDYLLALGQAVRDAVSRSQTPELALQSATTTWDALTEKVGRDRQRTAYLRSLGAEDFEPPRR